MDSRTALQVRSDSEKLRSFIADYVGVDVKEVTDEADLCDDLGLDWLDQLELLVVIEDKFVGIDFFANTTAASLKLVGDLIQRHAVVDGLLQHVIDRFPIQHAARPAGIICHHPADGGAAGR